MQTVVEKGTGTQRADRRAPTVGGKTGTAQHGENNSKTPYAWFTSYAQGPTGKEVAVAVVVEQSDAARSEVSGNGLAAPVAKAMMEAALDEPPERPGLAATAAPDCGAVAAAVHRRLLHAEDLLDRVDGEVHQEQRRRSPHSSQWTSLALPSTALITT